MLRDSRPNKVGQLARFITPKEINNSIIANSTCTLQLVHRNSKLFQYTLKDYQRKLALDLLHSQDLPSCRTKAKPEDKEYILV